MNTTQRPLASFSRIERNEAGEIISSETITFDHKGKSAMNTTTKTFSKITDEAEATYIADGIAQFEAGKATHALITAGEKFAVAAAAYCDSTEANQDDLKERMESAALELQMAATHRAIKVEAAKRASAAHLVASALFNEAFEAQS